MNSNVNRSLLKIFQRFLKGELRGARRRRSSRAPLWIAVLTVTVFGLSQFLEEPTAPLPAKGAELSCRVGEVYDGDTLAMRCDNGKLKVRVWGIDAPEMGQSPWGGQSRDRLQDLLSHDAIRVKVVDTDRYGRTVARLYDNEQDIGLALVRQGQAVVYSQYNNSADYRKAQEQARRQRLGVWSQQGAQQEPWEWRKVNPRS